MERPAAAFSDTHGVHVIIARRKRPNTSEFQLLLQRRSPAATADAGCWSFPGDYLSGQDLQTIPWDNYDEVVRRLYAIAERGTVDNLGRKPANMHLRTQALFQHNQKLFSSIGQRPCFLYLLDDVTDADFIKYIPKAKESKRASVDETFTEDSARNGYAWMDVRDIFRDLSNTNAKPFAGWVKEFLLALQEWKLTQMLSEKANTLSASKSNSYQEQMHSAGSPQEMVGMQQAMMNGAGYEASPMQYMDQMQYMPYQQQPQMYFYPQQQQQFAYASGRGQLKYRFPAHVLSLDVKTTGFRLHRDKIVSIGAALLTVDAAAMEPRLLQSRQFDFVLSAGDLDEEIPQDLFAAQQEPRPETDAIRAFYDFFMEISQKHPDMFIAADNPVVEVGIIDVTAGRLLPEKDFTSILHVLPPKNVEKRRNSYLRRDPVDLQSFACGLLKTDCNPVPVSSGPGFRWSTLKEYLEWYPVLSGLGPRTDVESRLPSPPARCPPSPMGDAANKGWMFLQCLSLLANQFERGASFQPFAPYSPPMMVAGGALPVQFAPQPYPSMLWQQQHQQQQHYYQQQQMQQMQQMQPGHVAGARSVGPHGHNRPPKHFNSYAPGQNYVPQQYNRSSHPNAMSTGANIPRNKGPMTDSSRGAEDSPIAQAKENNIRGDDSSKGPIGATESHPAPSMETSAPPAVAAQEQPVETPVTAKAVPAAGSPLPKAAGSPQPSAPRPAEMLQGSGARPADVASQAAQPVKGPQPAPISKGVSGTEGQQVPGSTPPKAVAPAPAATSSNNQALDGARPQGSSSPLGATAQSEKRAWKAVVAGPPKAPAVAKQQSHTASEQAQSQASGGSAPSAIPQASSRATQQSTAPAVGGSTAVATAVPSTIVLPSGVEVENPAATQDAPTRTAAPEAPREEAARKDSAGGWNGDGTEHRSSFRGGRGGGYRGGGPREGGGRGHRGGGGPRDSGEGRGGPSTPREHHSRGGGEGRGMSRGRGGPGGMMGRGRGNQPLQP